MCLSCLCNYFLFLMPATQAMESAVVSESHTRASRERLAREEANGPYFSRPRDALRSSLLKWRVSSPAMLKLDIYTMKIRPFFVEILLLSKKIYIYIKIKNINKYIKKR